MNDLVKLIHIVTLEDIDDYLFNKRLDTGQIVYPRDIKILKNLNPVSPIKINSFQKGYLFFPKEAVPEEANSVFYSKKKLDKGDFIESVYFCNTRLKADDGFRRIVKGDIILSHQHFIKGEYQIGNIHISVSIG